MAKKDAAVLNNINDLAAWISEGQRVGFTTGGKSYSVGYGTYADGQGFISLNDLERETPLGCYMDLYEFLTYARVPSGFVADLWPTVTDIKIFISKEEAQQQQ